MFKRLLACFFAFFFILGSATAQVEKQQIKAFARQMVEKGLIPESEYENIVKKVDSMSDQQMKDIKQVGQMHKGKVKDSGKQVDNDLDVAVQHIDTNSDEFKSMTEALKVIFEKNNAASGE